MMADLVDVARGGVPPGSTRASPARARSRSAKLRPAPNAPTRRKLRRVMPSQKRCLAPQMVNMELPPLSEPWTTQPLMVTCGGWVGQPEFAGTYFATWALRVGSRARRQGATTRSMKLRIVIPTTGSRGDVQPYVALG